MQSWNEIETYNNGMRAFAKGQALADFLFPAHSRSHASWRDGWLEGMKGLDHREQAQPANRP